MIKFTEYRNKEEFYIIWDWDKSALHPMEKGVREELAKFTYKFS